MRLDGDKLVLSERNILTLLTKLYTKDSACEIQGGTCVPLHVKAEDDETHYDGRDEPGEMHPITETLLRAVKRVTKGASINSQMVDAGFTEDVLDKLKAIGLPILYVHGADDLGPSAVILTSEHWNKIMDLLPEGEEITDLVMQHEHVVGEQE